LASGVALLSAGASLAVRLRRARGEQRQQLKWLAYAAVLTAIAWAASTISFLLFGTPWVACGPGHWSVGRDSGRGWHRHPQISLV
jgi:hypothetical protein